ncbi:MAG: hypothetical protein COV67_12415 [Nitrospinae bacterium CG11_big_fil_rev_8_21_14_0_20_56_8]|nr:MAG: hypothetical protein COV67_12415 [Nitrospinae bacterium CG11_big_fil_rev_8_21_14_0_20_56_8]
MKISGRGRFFVLLAVFLGLSAWLLNSGQLTFLTRGLKGLTGGGGKQNKLKAEDFDFELVQKRDVHQKVLATGTVTLKTGAEVKIGARVSGQLQELKVKIGDYVKEGDTIAVIEHEDMAARVSRLRAELLEGEASLEKIVQEGPLEVNKDRAEIEQLNTQLRLAEKMFKRNTELNEKGVVSDTVVDQALEEVEVLQSKIKLSQEQLKLQQTQVKMDAQLARARVERARANLMEGETQLSYATIKASMSGIVAFISTQEGETVVASLSAPTFVNLLDLSKLEVTTYVDETDIGRVKMGQQALFTVDTYPEKFFKSVVREIHPKAVIKDNVVNYEVILEIDKEAIQLLRPEMTANVVITTGVHKDVRVIPKRAVKREGKKTFAVVRERDKLVEKTIETGWREDQVIEVTSGLNEGEQVGLPKKPELGENGNKGPGGPGRRQ